MTASTSPCLDPRTAQIGAGRRCQIHREREPGHNRQRNTHSDLHPTLAFCSISVQRPLIQAQASHVPDDDRTHPVNPVHPVVRCRPQCIVACVVQIIDRMDRRDRMCNMEHEESERGSIVLLPCRPADIHLGIHLGGYSACYHDLPKGSGGFRRAP
jgi:hypothetical protein